ncbi:hypothetical protein AB9K41_23520 [Cribrihabitans sp. XS_ASV171]
MTLAWSTAFAQSTTGTSTASNPDAEAFDCARTLSDPPFAGLHGEELMRLGASKRGGTLSEPLIGQNCPKEVIVRYFEAGRWKLQAEGEMALRESIVPAARANHWLSFCLPRAIPMRWIDRCRATANVYSLDGAIIEIRSGFSK